MSTFNSVALARPRLGRSALLPVLGLLHFSALLLFNAQWHQSSPKPAPTERIEMRLLPIATPKPLPPQASRSAAPFAAPLAARSNSIKLKPPDIPSLTRPDMQQEQIVDAKTPAEPTGETAAPALLINSEATRRAMRQATRAPLLSERAAQAMGDGPPLEQSVRLGQEIKKAGNGDCLKGEFAGGGAGLLSLPFWLLAEARGKCAR
jgi:hypothetical protein